MKLSVCAVAVVASLAGIGCKLGNTTSASSDILISTDKVLYLATSSPPSASSFMSYRFTVVLRVQNLGTKTVTLDRCFPDSPTPRFSIVATEGGKTVQSAFEPIWGCVAHDSPIILAPGTVGLYTLNLVGPTVRDNGQTVGSLSGRLRILPAISFGDGTSPKDAPVSNAFDVQLGT
ncbi:MAG TPA: hypothetical protein VM099_14370 [Gemmatimonadaceae bacterium]|nr:hypothetical protein [Gemmatimonadaceae bacterium]